jgi:mono/diheme cytochrome c family protein
MSESSHPREPRPLIPGQVASWLGLVAFLAAAAVVVGYAYFATRPSTNTDVERRAAQKALRAKTETEGQALLAVAARNADGTFRVPVETAMSVIAADPKALASFKPAPAAPVVAPAAAATAFVAADEATLKRGAAVYARTCLACHQPTGKGLPPVFPSIAGTPIVVGNPELPIKFILQGLMGPITIEGTTYNSMMPPVGGVSDQDIADVLTYVRQSFGNRGTIVTPAQVKAVRDATAGRTAPWNTAELGLK